jgi:hypothetical protein
VVAHIVVHLVRDRERRDCAAEEQPVVLVPVQRRREIGLGVLPGFVGLHGLCATGPGDRQQAQRERASPDGGKWMRPRIQE